MPEQRITHGRHCTCSACAREDWTNPDLAPCGMHGEDCPALYQPWGGAGSYFDPALGRERAVDTTLPAPVGASGEITPRGQA